MWQQQLNEIKNGNIKTLARCISLIENEAAGFENLMEQIPYSSTPVIGITGPPGAGKSTLVDALIELIVNQNKKVAILCIDPSSPFNLGALLGDRIRMSEWYNNPNVFIRSLASRGSLGGLHPKIIEITELIKTAPFDYIVVETVGVGQSEVEIAGLANTTIVVLVPEAGDEIQTMKAGLMEIADIFVVNKADRPDAGSFIKNLQLMLAPAFNPNSQKGSKTEISIIKTIASQKTGIEELLKAIESRQRTTDDGPQTTDDGPQTTDDGPRTTDDQRPTANRQPSTTNNLHSWLLAEKAFHLIKQKRVKDIDKEDLKNKIEAEGNAFNLYQFIKKY